MPEQLKLEVVTSTAEPVLCALCGEMFSRLPAAVILFDGEVPLGHVCEACLFKGPQHAAIRMLEHAQKLRTLAEHAASLPRPQSAQVIQTMLDRAKRAFELAERVDKIESWDLKGMRKA